MFKLLKWGAIAGLVAVGGAFFLFGTQAGSYVRTAAGSLRDGIHDQIPLDFELRRAAKLIDEIEPQLRDAHREVAQAEVDLANTQREVESLQEQVADGHAQLRAVSASLAEGSGEVRLASWERSRVQFNLERNFEQHKHSVGLLEAKRTLLERQQRAVVVARSHFEAVRAEKERLEGMIAQLRAQKRQLDAMAASSKKFELDDSALGDAKELLDQIKNRLDVAQRMMEDEMFFDAEEEGARSNPDIAREVQTWLEQHGATESIEMR